MRLGRGISGLSKPARHTTGPSNKKKATEKKYLNKVMYLDPSIDWSLPGSLRLLVTKIHGERTRGPRWQRWQFYPATHRHYLPIWLAKPESQTRLNAATKTTIICFIPNHSVIHPACLTQ